MPAENKIPALFLHIQKTAGTSIVHMAARHYGNSDVSSHGDFEGRDPHEFSNTAFVSGHFGYDFARTLMQDRYTFTFLRDPIERVLSFYYFCRGMNPEERPIYRVARNLDLEDFIRAAVDDDLVKKRIWNNQVWRIATGPGSTSTDDMTDEEMLELATSHLEEFSHVGFTETFDKDVKIIMRGLEITSQDLPEKVNVTEDRITASDISASLLSMIEEITQLDRKLYDIAWNLRNSCN